MKKIPGNIIILHMCTTNYDEMMYGSWDMVRDRCNCYFSFSAIFCPFTPLTAQKIKVLKFSISSFYISVSKIMTRWCTVPEMCCMTDGRTDRWMDRKSVPPKTSGDIILQKCTKNHDHMLYCSRAANNFSKPVRHKLFVKS